LPREPIDTPQTDASFRSGGIARGEGFQPMLRMWKGFAIAALLLLAAPAYAADEIHWTLTGPASVTFDWRGAETSIRYGLTAAFGDSAVAGAPWPTPWSSAGPFREAKISGLLPDTPYFYSIGGGPTHTFRTARRPGASDFTVMVEGDIGSNARYWRMGFVQQQIAAASPAFALLVGDLTYGNAHGQVAVDNHFNDVMVWSQDAAYMPAWGNHEYENGAFVDDLRNYKGRFDLPNPQTSPGSPSVSCCGEDWYWFDYGNVRFIAYPEPWAGAWADWFPRAAALMDSAEANPSIAFVVTFGHRPAWSSGHHPGDATLRSYLGELGRTHAKYRLNLNGHSHDYERTQAIDGVVHVTSGAGGADLEEDWRNGCPWLGACPPPSWSAFRAFRHHVIRLQVGRDRIDVDALCGPSVPSGDGRNDLACTPGTVFDHVTITRGSTVPPPPQAALAAGPRVVPLPWAGAGYVSFQLTRDATTTAEILDVTGRVVRRLLPPTALEAGARQVAFDGVDDHGNRLPNGMYFVRVAATGGGTATRTFSIVR